jgi:hypothetical protein
MARGNKGESNGPGVIMHPDIAEDHARSGS